MGNSNSSGVIAPRITEFPSGTQTAIFAAGCFWSVELYFQRVEGILDTHVGYCGGTVDKPTYKQVCSGDTGHAEAVEIKFDPAKVSYEDLVRKFFKKHDPTTLNRQGNDWGTQYRSAIFYLDEEQKKIATQVKDELQKEIREHCWSNREIVTEITSASTFWAAEEYHQRYLEKGGQCGDKGCKIDISPYGR